MWSVCHTSAVSASVIENESTRPDPSNLRFNHAVVQMILTYYVELFYAIYICTDRITLIKPTHMNSIS